MMCNHKLIGFGADENGNYRICGRCGKKIYIITNADRIRAMSDEDLAKLLLDGCTGSKCEDRPQNKYGSVDCFQCRIDWLQQPAEEVPDGH